MAPAITSPQRTRKTLARSMARKTVPAARTDAAGTLERLEVNGRERITAASLDRYVGRTPTSVGLDNRALAGLLRQFADWLESRA